jgi:hypothetical protein
MAARKAATFLDNRKSSRLGVTVSPRPQVDAVKRVAKSARVMTLLTDYDTAISPVRHDHAPIALRPAVNIALPIHAVPAVGGG